jgi:eukaryotic-like serine/threonine-protein kinase
MDQPQPTSAIKRFGRYEILGELGRGAMGVVYKARDPRIDRLVAVKTVSLRGQEPDAEQEFRLRFLNEAQAAGRLHHPGIVAVFDVGEEPETRDPFIVLEYVAGEALNRKLAREKKLPLDRALQLTQEIASALDYAHGQGVTHRDIKPGNILLTQDGHAKVADFGIAKLNLAHLTVPGKLLGTPAYMAPEQLTGTGSDGRSDLFSLGVILYAMVTGHSPFQGDSATTVCFKVANREPVPASALDLDLPRELDAIISRAMAKEPKRRYQRGVEFAEAIAELQASCLPGSAATRTGTRSRSLAQGQAFNGPAAGLAYAARLVRASVLKAPVKDIVLGVATVLMLLIVGVQTKLLVLSHNEARNEAHNEMTTAAEAVPIAPSPAINVSVSAKPAVPAPAPAPPAKAAKGTVVNVSAKTSSKHAGSPDGNPAANVTKDNVVKEVVVPLSTVELSVRHQFKDATLTVWVDGKLALTEPLHGGTQKHLVVFSGVRGVQTETLQVPAGKHTLKFRAQTSDQTVDLSKTISADLIGGGDKTLAVSFDKHNTAMLLDWQ